MQLVCSFLKFLFIWPNIYTCYLIIYTIYIYCTWWYLTMISSDWRNQIFENKILRPKFEPNKQAKIRPKNEVFRYFLEFGSLAFLEIAYNNSLQQCLTPSRGKTHEKNFGTKIWVKRTKIEPEIRFFAIFSSLVH